MIPRRVARHLASWGYDPASPQFGTNYLSAKVERTRRAEEGDHFAFVSLCAVPHSTTSDIYSDFSEIVTWLQPQSLIRYDPGGIWLPLSSRTFASQGLILCEDDRSTDVWPYRWSSYLMAGRDSYFEYGRRAGWKYKDHWVYPFAPMIAWIQQFTALVQEARTKQSTAANYSIVLNLPQLQGSALISLGDGWAEPFQWTGDPFPTPIEASVQLHIVLADASPREVGRWFAERVDNVFGVNETWPRCYNHPSSKGTVGAPGDLPTNRLSYR